MVCVQVTFEVEFGRHHKRSATIEFHRRLDDNSWGATVSVEGLDGPVEIRQTKLVEFHPCVTDAKRLVDIAIGRHNSMKVA